MKRHELNSENFSKKGGRRYRDRSAGRAIGTITGGTIRGAVKTSAIAGGGAIGAGAGIGALAAGLATGGLGAPAGAAIGAGIGAVGGAIATPLAAKLGAIYGASKAATKVAKGNYSENFGLVTAPFTGAAKAYGFFFGKSGAKQMIHLPAAKKTATNILGAQKSVNVYGANKIAGQALSGARQQSKSLPKTGELKSLRKNSSMYKQSQASRQEAASELRKLRQGVKSSEINLRKTAGGRTYNEVLRITKNRELARVGAHLVDNRGKYMLGGLGVAAAGNSNN